VNFTKYDVTARFPEKVQTGLAENMTANASIWEQSQQGAFPQTVSRYRKRRRQPHLHRLLDTYSVL